MSLTTTWLGSTVLWELRSNWKFFFVFPLSCILKASAGVGKEAEKCTPSPPTCLGGVVWRGLPSMLRIFSFSELGCNFSAPRTIRMTWAVFPVKWLRLILFWWLLSHVIPWLPGVFLACGGNFRCWPKADTSSDSPDSGIQVALQWENNCLCQSVLQCQFASFLTAVHYSRFKNTWLGIYELFL